jgi:hypothetical protein
MEEVTYKKDYVSVSTRLAKEDALKLKRKCAWMHLSPSEWIRKIIHGKLNESSVSHIAGNNRIEYNQEKDNFNWNVVDEVGDVFKIAENVSLEFVEELVKELDFVLHKRNESLGKRKRKSIGVPRGLGA